MGKNFDDAAGKGKEAFGKLSGDSGEEAEGKADQAKAGAKEKAEQAKKKAEEAADNVTEKARDAFKKR
ncbi:CsbD family protein [Nocardiopsis kunsanensis]|uniref:CsbD-like domain-containing protein n=1 Tax=Nocardiopsis kunsanensis TaxID=141693 RepID=A0A918XB43_9ACTN|nr:CsbD family protein [Nocardiopsis kunsanensis]GHD20978.1 hypothetical protein GCM10007147_13870 [Nocardiopsis kunsanensis]